MADITETSFSGNRSQLNKNIKTLLPVTIRFHLMKSLLYLRYLSLNIGTYIPKPFPLPEGIQFLNN